MKNKRKQQYKQQPEYTTLNVEYLISYFPIHLRYDDNVLDYDYVWVVDKLLLRVIQRINETLFCK